MKKIINTTNAPAALGPYSQAIEANGVLYVSGQIPFVPATMTLVSEDVEAQTKTIFGKHRSYFKRSRIWF